MADLPPFEASWGNIKLFCQHIATQSGRTKIVHDLSSGDKHPTQDRGRHARRVRCRLLFDHFEGFPEPVEAANMLEAAVASGESAVFTHPMLGSYIAGVGDFDGEIDENGVITAEVEFIPDDDIPPVQPAGPGTTAASGELLVNAAADEMDAATSQVLTDAEIREILEDENGVSVTDDARQSVASWNSGELVDGQSPTRQVLIDVARLGEKLFRAVREGNFENDIALWDCFRTSILLGEAVRLAAVAVTSEVSSVFVMRIETPTALLPLCARVYGGAEAEDRARQVSQLNDISTPGWLTPGDYVMPARGPGRRLFG